MKRKWTRAVLFVGVGLGFVAHGTLKPLPPGKLPDAATLKINAGHTIQFAHPLPLRRRRRGRLVRRIARAFVRSCVGHLTIVDSDCVCVSNVNRQVMATTQMVGVAKVDVLAARLHDINPACDVVARREVYSPETAAAFDVGSYDYVVDAIDSLANKAHLLVHATSFARPTLFASMGTALKTDPFCIRKAEFWKIAGDPLAHHVFSEQVDATMVVAFTLTSDKPPSFCSMGRGWGFVV